MEGGFLIHWWVRWSRKDAPPEAVKELRFESQADLLAWLKRETSKAEKGETLLIELRKA